MTKEEFLAALNGPNNRYFILADGENLSLSAAEECQKEILFALENPGVDDQWLVIATELNTWYDEDLICVHTGETIPWI